jgi:hypothetical protein
MYFLFSFVDLTLPFFFLCHVEDQFFDSQAAREAMARFQPRFYNLKISKKEIGKQKQLNHELKRKVS